MNIENLLSGFQDQSLTDGETRLIKEVTEQMNTDEGPYNLRSVRETIEIKLK